MNDAKSGYDVVMARFKEILELRGYSQIEAVEKCKPHFFLVDGRMQKVTASDLNQYIKGKAIPRSFKATILGNALGVSPAWLMGFDVPMQGSLTQKKSLDITSISEPRAALIKMCMEASEEDVAMLYRLVAAALNVKV